MYQDMTPPAKPSRFGALAALLTAFFLPFLLVKIFSDKPADPKPLSPAAPRASTQDIRALPPVNSMQQLKEPVPSATVSKAVDIAKPAPSSKPIQKIVAAPKKAEPILKNRQWTTVSAKPGDSLISMFKRVGLSSKTLLQILQNNPYRKQFTRIKAGDEIRFFMRDATLEKMSMSYSFTHTLEVYQERGHYKTRLQARKFETKRRAISASVNGSLYLTAKQHQIPAPMIRKMIEVLAPQINLNRELRKGDHINMVFTNHFIKNKPVGTGDLLGVSYRHNGQVYQAFRYTNTHGQTDYYTTRGESSKKAFNRYPVRFSHISSTFSLSRYHPILHYHRAHKGVDLAAHIGTPVTATGDGRIEIIGRQGAYGNMIKIRHNGPYASVYGHMLRFARGLYRGSYVKRGQVIGYVGQTGLASGPHCHYEFHVNNQARNPTTVPLPNGIPLYGRDLVRFRANANQLLAEMSRNERTSLAKR